MQGWLEAERRLARRGTTAAHTLLTTQPAASTVPFPPLRLSHVGSCTLCKGMQCGPANVCFLFLNSVASSHFKRGVNFTIRFIPLETVVWQCPLPYLHLPYVTYLRLDPEEGRQGGVLWWQGRLTTSSVPMRPLSSAVQKGELDFNLQGGYYCQKTNGNYAQKLPKPELEIIIPTKILYECLWTVFP